MTVFLCKTKIDDIDLIASFADTHEEVVGFDVSMNKEFGVNELNTRDLSKSTFVTSGSLQVGPQEARQF